MKKIQNVEQMIADYQSGIDIRTLAAKYSVCTNTIRDNLKRAGVYVPLTGREPVEFWCRTCGVHVITQPEQGDKRTVFCCEHCEKKFWRDQTRHRKGFHFVNVVPKK